MSVARRAFRRLRAQALEWSGANAAARARLDGSRAAVLMYHRVLPRSEAERLRVEPGMFVTPGTFGRHLDWIGASFRVVPLRDLVTRLAEGRTLPDTACALTFDDGWRDNYEHAFPELERRGLPATIFLVTERVGTMGAFWPDEVCRLVASAAPVERQRVAADLGALPGGDPALAALTALKQLSEAERDAAIARVRSAMAVDLPVERELLDWQEVDRMAGGGIEFEAHGATHAILTGVPSRAAELELRRARETLEARGHGRGRLLAYASGAHDARVRAIAREAGFRAAVTTLRGCATTDCDLMALPRVGLHEDISRSRPEFHYLVPGLRT